MDVSESEEEREQSLAWEALYAKIIEHLANYGVDNGFSKGQYFVVDDNYGGYCQSVEVHDLSIFRPDIVAGVHALLNDFPNWEIVMRIDVPGKEQWPAMGLTIRKREIIEVLQRSLLPEYFEKWHYPGSRPGTKYD